MNKKILIVAAHPDDEVLGCFGTVARLIQEGYEAYTLILGEGKTSRDEKRVVENKKDELDILNSEIKNIKITLAILIVFSLAVLTYYVLWRVIEYLEEKEKENPESLINDKNNK